MTEDINPRARHSWLHKMALAGALALPASGDRLLLEKSVPGPATASAGDIPTDGVTNLSETDYMTLIDKATHDLLKVYDALIADASLMDIFKTQKMTICLTPSCDGSDARMRLEKDGQRFYLSDAAVLFDLILTKGKTVEGRTIDAARLAKDCNDRYERFYKFRFPNHLLGAESSVVTGFDELAQQSQRMLANDPARTRPSVAICVAIPGILRGECVCTIEDPRSHLIPVSVQR